MAGNNYGDISNSHATGNVTITAFGYETYEIGGLVGYNEGDMTNVYTTGNVTITSDGTIYEIGGLVGDNKGATLKDIALENRVLTIGKESEPYDAEIFNIGLLAGNFSGTIENSHAAGEINIFNGDGSIDHVGGLIGAGSGETIPLRIPLDDMTSEISRLEEPIVDVKITDSSADVNIKIEGGNSVSSAAGLIGSLIGSSDLKNCYAAGDITIDTATEYGVRQIAGLIGFVSESGNLEKCYATGDISITAKMTYVNDVAGLVGYIINDGSIQATCDMESCYATGDITINAIDVEYVGGLVSDYNGHMSNSYAAGDIEIFSEDVVIAIGGLVGGNGGDMTNSYAAGNVTIETTKVASVGGLAGENYIGDITNSYTTGSVKITSDSVLILIVSPEQDPEDGEDGAVGGLVGLNDGTVSNCYALNKEVTLTCESDNIGKAIGYSGGEATDVYAWDGMEGTFTNELDEPEPITSAEVWNKIDWIGDGSTWKVNNYSNFRLPVPIDQEETTEADASHLNPSPSSGGGSGGSGTGSATVVDLTANTNESSSTNEGFGEEIDNGSTEAGDDGSGGGDGSSDGGGSGSGDSGESGSNWTVIVVVAAAAVVVAVAGGLYLYKAGKLKF